MVIRLERTFEDARDAVRENHRSSALLLLLKLERQVLECLAEVDAQAMALADANARSVDLLMRQRDLAERIEEQNRGLREQNRALQAEREDLAHHLDRLADANVDAVMIISQGAERFRELEDARVRLVKQNRELASRARDLEGEAMMVADSTVEAVLMLEQREDQLRALSDRTRALESENERLGTQATVDERTGLYNSYYLDEHLAREIARAERHGTPLSLLFIDADHFKAVNDTWGHEAGDRVLLKLGSVLRHELRCGDLAARLDGDAFAARYGGEEFVVILPNTPLEGAAAAAERVRSTVCRTPHGPLATGMLTVSIGVADLQPGEDGAALLRRADEALYHAKDAGRNRVTLSRPDTRQ